MEVAYRAWKRKWRRRPRLARVLAHVRVLARARTLALVLCRDVGSGAIAQDRVQALPGAGPVASAREGEAGAEVGVTETGARETAAPDEDDVAPVESGIDMKEEKTNHAREVRFTLGCTQEFLNGVNICRSSLEAWSCH